MCVASLAGRRNSRCIGDVTNDVAYHASFTLPGAVTYSPSILVNVPSPFVVSTTSPSRAVDQSRSEAGTSNQCLSVAFLQDVFDGPGSKAKTVPAPAPPNASVSTSTVTLRGWQYDRFMPASRVPEEMTAYFGWVCSRKSS